MLFNIRRMSIKRGGEARGEGIPSVGHLSGCILEDVQGGLCHLKQAARSLPILPLGLLLLVTLALAHVVQDYGSDDHPCVSTVNANCFYPDQNEHVYIPPSYLTYGFPDMWFTWEDGAHHHIRFRREHKFCDRNGHGIYLGIRDTPYVETGPKTIYAYDDTMMRWITADEVQGWGQLCDASTRSCVVCKDDGPTPTATDVHSFLLN